MEKRNYSLDFIKILATTAIVFHHWQQGTGAQFSVINFYGGTFNFAYLVELFFMISGMLSYHYIYKFQNGLLSTKEFLLKRYIRLIPLVAISVVFEAVVRIYICTRTNRDIGFDLWNVVQNIFGVQQGWVTNSKSINAPTWYISVLLLCYVFFVFAMALSKRLKTSEKYFFATMILIGVAIDTYQISLPFFNKSASRGYVAFFVGVLLKSLLNKSKEINKNLCVIATIAISMCIFIIIGYPTFIMVNIYWILVFIIYPALLILAQSQISQGIFRFRFIGTLSKISFHVYVWHETIAVFRSVLIYHGIELQLFSVSTMLYYAAISWVMGSVSYYLLEKKLLKDLDKKIFVFVD